MGEEEPGQPQPEEGEAHVWWAHLGSLGISSRW